MAPVKLPCINMEILAFAEKMLKVSVIKISMYPIQEVLLGNCPNYPIMNIVSQYLFF